MADIRIDTSLEGDAHIYRKLGSQFEQRTGAAFSEIERRGSGEERELVARLDSALSSHEREIQAQASLRAAEAKVKELEARLAEPVLRGSAAKTPADPTDSPEYSRRWLRAVLTNDQAELRVLLTSTSNAAVPTDMERRIINKMYQASVLRSIATVQRIDSKRTITVEATTPAAALIAENGAITPADHTFAAVSVQPYKFVAATTMSQEFIEDSLGTGGIGTGLDWVADRLAISLAREMDEYFVIGSGSSQPQGIGDTSSTAWATTNSGRIINQGVALTEDQTIANITSDNVIDCVHAVAPQYRTGGRFRILVHDDCVKALRKLRINNEVGNYIWKASETGGLSDGVPGTIYGVPYVVSEWMPTTAAQTATGADVRGSALFIVGNFEYFGIFDRTGITQLVDPYSGSANMRTTLYVSARTDSKILLPEAFAAIYAPNAS